MSKGGVLFLPLSSNVEVMKNIIRIVSSEKSRAEYKLPCVDIVTFLDSTGLKMFKTGGREVPVVEVCRKIAQEDGIGFREIRVRKIDDYVKEIPDVIMNAAREIGKDNIILDLTSGRKDITGSLYTAGSIGQIDNMIYIEVLKDSQGNFYSLDPEDESITEKFRLTKFQSFSEIQNLASLNGMDFIFYKKRIDSIKELCGEENSTIQLYCSHLSEAVNHYFKGDAQGYNDCIHSVGIMNESLNSLLNQYILRVYGAKFPEIQSKQKWYIIEKLEDIYNNLAYKNFTKKLTEEDEVERYELLQDFFRYNPCISELTYAIRRYRNREAHRADSEVYREDAKLALEMLLKLFDGLGHAGILSEVLQSE